MPDSLRRLRTRVVRRATLGGLALCTLTWRLVSPEAALGLGLGVGVGIVTFHLHGAEATATVTLAPGTAERRARLGSLARTGVRAVALAVAYLRPEVSFPWAAAGLLTIPALLALGILARGAARP